MPYIQTTFTRSPLQWHLQHGSSLQLPCFFSHFLNRTIFQLHNTRLCWVQYWIQCCPYPWHLQRWPQGGVCPTDHIHHYLSRLLWCGHAPLLFRSMPTAQCSSSMGSYMVTEKVLIYMFYIYIPNVVLKVLVKLVSLNSRGFIAGASEGSEQSIGGASRCLQIMACASNTLSPQSLPTPLIHWCTCIWMLLLCYIYSLILQWMLLKKYW